MQRLGPLFRLSQAEKDRCQPSDVLDQFGYKKVGGSVVDHYNTTEHAEIFNASGTLSFRNFLPPKCLCALTSVESRHLRTKIQ